MMILTLEENDIYNNGSPISDFPTFLKNLPSSTEMALVLKTQGILYHLCLIRKSVPFLRSGEFSPDDWVGEKRLPKSHTLVGGTCPSLFMRTTIRLLTNHSYAVKGVFLWADLVMQAYGALPLGWTLILHKQHLLICYDGILRVSRRCYLPFLEELPEILRYLKRFGYQEEAPLTLLSSSTFTKSLPPFIHQQTRKPLKFSFEGFTFHIPELISRHRLYHWPRAIRKIAYAVTFLSVLSSIYLTWQIKVMTQTKHIIKSQINKLPQTDPVDIPKMEAFSIYCRLIKSQQNPLLFFRYLMPFIKGKAVANHLHWSNPPWGLSLYLEFNPSIMVDQFLSTLQSQLQGFFLTWEPENKNSFKGILTIKKIAPQKIEE